jgi:hypothetical protein
MTKPLGYVAISHTEADADNILIHATPAAAQAEVAQLNGATLRPCMLCSATLDIAAAMQGQASAADWWHYGLAYVCPTCSDRGHLPFPNVEQAGVVPECTCGWSGTRQETHGQAMREWTNHARTADARIAGYVLLHRDPADGEPEEVRLVIEHNPEAMQVDADRLNALHGTDYRVYALMEVPRG